MRSFARTLTVISALGFILSTGAAVNAFARYLTLYHRTSTLDTLAPDRDSLAPRLSSLLAEHPNKEIVVGELRTRHELNTTLHSTLVTIIADSKDNAKADTVLWIGEAVLFFLVLLRSEQLRRGEKIATGA